MIREEMLKRNGIEIYGLDIQKRISEGRDRVETGCGRENDRHIGEDDIIKDRGG